MLKLTADSYTKYQAYPSDIFEVPGFKDFVENGYYRLIEAEKKNPYVVLKTSPRLRGPEEIKIFKEYCQRFELLADRDEEFYSYLHLGVRVVEGF